MIEKPFTEILRLPITALKERVQQEVLENPVLEWEEETGSERAVEEVDQAPYGTCPNNDSPIMPLRLYRTDSDALPDDSEVSDPQQDFSGAEVSQVEADVAIERMGKGRYEARPLDDWAARLFVSHQYLELCRQSDIDAKTREYLERKIRSARSLIRAIAERRTLLEAVIGTIIEQQRSFLDTGLQPIETLDLRRLADRAGLSLAKVKKVVKDKWAQTPHGTFPLARFFQPFP